MIDNDESVLKGEQPSKEDLEYISWGFEIFKKKLDFANEFLRQLITLNVAIIGICIALIEKNIINSGIGKSIAIVFFISLITSFLGALPYENKIYLDCPDDIKRMVENSFKWKRSCLWLASLLFFISFIILSLVLLQ